MSKFFASVVEYAIMAAVLGLGVWFGGPAIFRHVQEGEAAKVTVRAQVGALAADTAATNRQQKSCADEIAAAGKAQAAVARASQVQPAAAGQPRAMIGFDQLSAIIGPSATQ